MNFPVPYTLNNMTGAQAQEIAAGGPDLFFIVLLIFLFAAVFLVVRGIWSVVKARLKKR